MMFIWYKEISRFVPEYTNDEDNNYWFMYFLPWIYSAGTENILGVIEQDASKVSNGIFSDCTNITLGGIWTTAGAEIYGSLYQYWTMTDKSGSKIFIKPLYIHTVVVVYPTTDMSFGYLFGSLYKYMEKNKKC